MHPAHPTVRASPTDRGSWPSPHECETLLLEVWIECESLGNASLSHRDEGHGVDEAQSPLMPCEEEVETGVVQGRVNPDDVEQGREIRANTSNRLEPQPPADEGVGLNENERRAHQRRLARPQRRERALRLRVIRVCGVEQRPQARTYPRT